MTQAQTYLSTLIFTAFFWNGCVWIFMGFRKLYPDYRQTTIRLLWTILSILALLSVGSIPIRLLVHYIGLHKTLDVYVFLKYFPYSFIASLVVGLIYENVFFFDKWKQMIQKNEELKNQQIRMQFEVLQNQMSPHFLFNSLNALTTLIAENQENAIEFTQRLSDMYRYILQTKNKELVHLSEELQFVETYLFLLQMRYPENLAFHLNVPQEYLDRYIPPLTLQMLAENAIKHNIISKHNPLRIDIYVENSRSVVVKNNLQLKNTIEKSTKTGLVNIRKRFELLGKENIDVVSTQNSYLVTVPLINLVIEREITDPV